MPQAISLDVLRIASPCSADWDDMKGDERARHCEQCDKHVYNIASMTREEATALIQKHEGKLCVRLYKRPDGTVLTSDCPVGRRIKLRWAAIKSAAAVCGFALLGGLGALIHGKGVRAANAAIVDPIQKLFSIDQPQEMPHQVSVGVMGEPVAPPQAIMGDIAVPMNPPIMGGLMPPQELPAEQEVPAEKVDVPVVRCETEPVAVK